MQSVYVSAMMNDDSENKKTSAQETAEFKNQNHVPFPPFEWKIFPFNSNKW